MMTTRIGRLYLTAVANSPISIVKAPSPTKAIDLLSGNAICAAIEYGSPGAIVASVPEQLNFWSPCITKWRAIHDVFVPESPEIIALSGASFDSSHATRCGLIG